MTVVIDVNKLPTGPLVALKDAVTTVSCVPHAEITQISFAETNAVVKVTDLVVSLVMQQSVERERARSKAYLLWQRLLAAHLLKSWCAQCRHPVAGDAVARHKEHVNELVVERSALVGLGDPSLLSFDGCSQLETEQLIVFLRGLRKG